MKSPTTPRSLRSTVLALLLLLWALPAVAILAAQTARPLPAGESAHRKLRSTARAPAHGDVLEGGQTHSRALVIALHGGSWKGDPPSELAQRTLAELSGPARNAGLRLLVPCAPTATGDGEYRVPWLTAEGEALVLALLDAEITAGRARRDSISLAGHGAGATGALTLVARHPDRIAAVAAWSGTPEPLWDVEHRVVGLAEDVGARLSATPVYLWTGADDRALDAAALQLFITGMRAARTGSDVLTFVREESAGGHGYGPAGPERGLKFLADHRLPARPGPKGVRPG